MLHFLGHPVYLRRIAAHFHVAALSVPVYITLCFGVSFKLLSRSFTSFFRQFEHAVDVLSHVELVMLCVRLDVRSCTAPNTTN